MNAWSYIIVGGVLIVGGGILAGYGWHIMPKSASLETDPTPITAQKLNSIPLIDLELSRVKADPEFAQFEIQFAYDIFIHNKSNVPISHIRTARTVISNKNRQKIAVHQKPQRNLRHFQRSINVLAPGERKQIYREHSSSYEYTRFTITYKDENGKVYKCIFEGDRDGVYLKNDPEIVDTKNKR